jgi:hypothetical protein
MTTTTPNPTGREVWLAHVKAWRACGLRKREYCATQGLKLSSLNYWCRVETATQPEPTLTLIPISQSSTQRSLALTLRHAHEWELSLSQEVAPAWVAELLKAL